MSESIRHIVTLDELGTAHGAWMEVVARKGTNNTSFYDKLRAVIQAYEDTRAPLQNGGTAGDEVARDAARLDWLESTMREYGDGYTEPREASISWIGWQQTKDEPTFPGLRKAIDAAIAQSHPINQAIAGKGEL